MPNARLLGAVTASFAIGALVGAGSLWFVQEGGPPTGQVAPAISQPAGTEQTPRTVRTTVEYPLDMTTIEYELTTDGMSVTHLSYVNVVEGKPVMEESLGSPPPFRHVMQFPSDEDFDLTTLSVTGMGAATSTTTTCTLRIDGDVVARQTTDGVYGLVSCGIPDGVTPSTG